LLAVFWDNHDPTKQPFSQQYKSIIFYHNEEQKRLAMETKNREEARTNTKILTEIIPATEFYLAEAYHQKYYLRGVPALWKEFNAIYPNINDFIASTAAARVNGYIGGYGKLETLEEEINDFGLSPAGNKKLLDIVSASNH